MTSSAMRRSAFAGLCLATMLGCGSITFPDRTPAIEGSIVGLGGDVPFGRDNPTSMWVKEDPTDACGIVFDTSEAEIGARNSDGSVSGRGVEDLALGQQVRVWAVNIADSCPGQSGATAVEILTD